MTMAATVEFDPDLSLIEAVRRREREACDRFVRHQERWVRGVIYGVLGDPDGVDDVAQQVWAAVWNRIGELRDPRRWKPWLYRLARNAAIDAGREQTRRRNQMLAADPGGSEAAPAPPHELSMRERHRAVLEAIRLLPPHYREPFVLRHLQDWSYRQIADLMDIPVDTVETRLVRARRQLRELLAGKV